MANKKYNKQPFLPLKAAGLVVTGPISNRFSGLKPSSSGRKFACLGVHTHFLVVF